MQFGRIIDEITSAFFIATQKKENMHCSNMYNCSYTSKTMGQASLTSEREREREREKS